MDVNRPRRRYRLDTSPRSAIAQEAQEFEVLPSPFWRLNEAGAMLTGIPALVEVHHPALFTAIRVVAEVVEHEDGLVSEKTPRMRGGPSVATGCQAARSAAGPAC